MFVPVILVLILISHGTEGEFELSLYKVDNLNYTFIGTLLLYIDLFSSSIYVEHS